MAKTAAPQTRELGLLESAIKAGGTPEQLADFMVAVDSSTGKTVAVWKGTSKRLSLGDGVVQYHVGKVRSAEAARRHGAVLFSARQPGE